MTVLMNNESGQTKEFDCLQEAYAQGFNQKTPLCEYCSAPAVATTRTSSGPNTKCCADCRQLYSKDWKSFQKKIKRPVGRPKSINK